MGLSGHILGKIKNLFKGPHGKFAWFVVVTTAVFLYAWTLGKGNTIFHWIQASTEVRRQMEQMEYYTDENAEMDRRLQMLRTDRDTLEKFAREQFRFAALGEDVYVIE